MNLRSAFLCLVPIVSQGCFAQATNGSVSDGLNSDPLPKSGSYSQSATVISLVGEAETQQYAASFAPDDELEFEVYVPKNYDPSAPAGLMVYVSPIPSGSIPDVWQEIFERRNMIWVSVNNSGNTMPAEQRLAEAKLAATFASRYYNIDKQRTYISGMSGGAQIATIASLDYPHLFKGGFFFCGVNPWSTRDADPWTDDPPDSLDVIRQNRYVFLSGTEDYMLASVARAYRLFGKAGIENSKLIVVDGMGHELPAAEDYDRALEFLDANSAVPVANSGKDPR